MMETTIEKRWVESGVEFIQMPVIIPSMLLKSGYLSLRYQHPESSSRSSTGVARWMALNLPSLGITVADKEVVDHIDGNPLNNRPDNLRSVSTRANSVNRRNTSSVYPGVSLCVTPERSPRWKTRGPRTNAPGLDLGSFQFEHDAARACRASFQDHPEHLDYPKIPNTPGRSALEVALERDDTDERGRLVRPDVCTSVANDNNKEEAAA